ncbi:MAG TPA: hypothetical protein VGZ90_04670 [Puia sp.]|nr:hypothetical protein [Puia sp.]
MKFNYRELLPEEMDGSSRVWIYQSSRLFTISEVFQIEDKLTEFVGSWITHGTPVKGYGNLFFGQFIILMADETASGVSGCSTDSSVRLIKEMENIFKVQLFDRQLLAFFVKDKVQLLPLSQLSFGAASGIILPDTLYFNNTVATKTELENNWIIPVKDSWLASRIAFPKAVSR